MKLLVFQKYKPIHLQLFETLSLSLYPVFFLFFRERASSYLFRFFLSFISILELQSPMEEFRLSALPEELQDLVVQGVAKNSFRDLFRLRTTSKHMKEITVSPGVYASLSVFNWSSHIPRPLRLYEECFAHGSPSTLYLKGSQYFFLYGFEEEGLALIKIVGVKNGHDEINIQIYVKISMNAFTKSNLRKEIFTNNFAVKSCTNIS